MSIFLSVSIPASVGVLIHLCVFIGLCVSIFILCLGIYVLRSVYVYVCFPLSVPPLWPPSGLSRQPLVILPPPMAVSSRRVSLGPGGSAPIASFGGDDAAFPAGMCEPCSLPCMVLLFQVVRPQGQGGWDWTEID